MLTRARPRVRRKFTRLPCLGGRDLGVSRLLGHPAHPPICHPTHLAHVLHDNVQAVVQDHA